MFAIKGTPESVKCNEIFSNESYKFDYEKKEWHIEADIDNKIDFIVIKHYNKIKELIEDIEKEYKNNIKIKIDLENKSNKNKLKLSIYLLVDDDNFEVPVNFLNVINNKILEFTKV
ncbi:MAG: hypothetical protein ACP5UN_00320 [Candidatus Micrarchaeia archaeon]